MPIAAIGIASAVGGIASSAIGAHSAGKAAQAQVDAANHAADLQHQDAAEALGFQRDQYNNSLRLLQPYYSSGTNSLNRLNFLMGLPNFDMSNFQYPGTAQTSQVPSFGSNFGDFSSDTNRLLQQDPFARLAMNGSLAPMPMGMTANPNAAPQTAAAMVNPQSKGNILQPFGGNPQSTSSVNFTSPNDGQPPINIAPMGMAGVNGGGTSTIGLPPSATDLPPTNQNFLGGFTGPDGGAMANGGPGNPLDGTSGGLSTSANGTPAQTTVPGDPNGGAGFGFLAQPWTDPFNAPTNVTEQNDPGWQFRLKQGQDALERSAAARGGLITGGTAKALDDYTQNSASQEYGNVYGRALGEYQQRYNIFKGNQNDLFNRFAAMAGLGQTSASQLSSAGQNFANQGSNILLTSGQQIGNNINNAGAARASGYVGQGNAISSGINGLSNLAMMYAMMRNNGGGTPDSSTLFSV